LGGAEADGLSIGQTRRLVADLRAANHVVGLTVAEFIPRQVVHLQQAVAGFPLLSMDERCSS
jgi:arginase